MPGDTSASSNPDIFVKNLVTGAFTLLTPNANNFSTRPSISADGRFTTFASTASNLVPNDVTAGFNYDIFVHDAVTSQTRILTPGGNSSSHEPVISADGKTVAFWSSATNLVPGNFTSSPRVYTADVATGKITLIAAGGSVSNMAPSISGDGRFITFASGSGLVAGDPNGTTADIFVADTVTGRIALVTPGANAGSANPTLSENGRHIVFYSNASNLSAGDTNNKPDVFIADNPLVPDTVIQVISPGAPQFPSSSLSFGAVPPNQTSNFAWTGSGAAPAVASAPSLFNGLHSLTGINDGAYGNSSSYIDPAPFWVKINLGTARVVDQVSLGRDRTGVYDDRDPGHFRIYVAATDNVYAIGNSTNDANEYTLVYDSISTGFNGFLAGQQTVSASFSPVLGRFVKIEFYTGAGGLEPAIDEIQVRSTTGLNGNDTFVATAPLLVPGTVINGEAGIDTLRIEGGGAISLVGVTLTGIESITLANAPSNTLTLGSAAQALLVTAAPGANDTVILDGFLTWPEQQALAATGVEHVQFTNANGTNTVNFAGGVLQTVEVDYFASNLLFKNATLTYNPALQITSARTLFDSSIEEVTTYVDGTRTTTVKTDTAGGAEQVWTQQTFTFTPAGALMSLDQDNDNGSAQRVEYGAGGVITRSLHTQLNGDTYDLRYDVMGQLTQTVFTDVVGSATAETFASYTNDFHAATLLKSTTVHDNGLRTVTNFVGNNKTSYEQYDDADIFTYDELLTTYAANGSTVISTVFTQDSGARNHHAGVDGATLTGNAANDSMTGALGANDVFVFAPGGGNDFVSNFENGVDHLNFAAFGFENFAGLEAIATGGPGWTYLSFADGGHLMINGLSRSALDTNDVII